MDTTVEAAQAGRKKPGMQSPRVARHSHEARAGFWRAFAVTSFFVVVLGANLYIGAVVIGGKLRTYSGADQTAAAGRTAQIKRALLDGTFCRNMVFDNATAQTIKDKVERCDGAPSDPIIKSPSQFNWGGK